MVRKKHANRPSEKHRRKVRMADGREVVNDAYTGPREPKKRALDNLSDLTYTNTDDEIERLYGDDAVPYEMNVPDELEPVLDDLYEIGNPLIVGGSVRDSLKGYDSKDMDIEVHGTDIDSLVSHLRGKGYHVDEVGKQFGVLKARKGKATDLDISVPRKENKTGAGHRAFDVVTDADMTPKEAAERRDFTFNALMYDHKRKVMVDPTGGKEDFENGIMKHVSDKFDEDPLRSLRGVQFAARFNMNFDPDTAEKCRSLRGEYGNISTERVQEEWSKLFRKGTNPEAGMKALQETGWDDTVPGLKEAVITNGGNLSRLPDTPQDRKIIQGAGELARGVTASGNNPRDFIKQTVTGKKEQAKALVLSELPDNGPSDDYSVRALAGSLSGRGLSVTDAEETYRLRGDDQGVKNCRRARELGVADKPEDDWVTGDDILSATDRKPGRWVKETLDGMRDKQYGRTVADRSEALAEMKRILGE